MSDLRDKLSSELMDIEWNTLAMHYRREALFIVDEAVTLLDVAVAVAEDDQASVKAWLESGALARPTEAQAEAFEADEATRFRSLIVQPFVLGQLLTQSDK